MTRPQALASARSGVPADGSPRSGGFGVWGDVIREARGNSSRNRLALPARLGQFAYGNSLGR